MRRPELDYILTTMLGLDRRPTPSFAGQRCPT